VPGGKTACAESATVSGGQGIRCNHASQQCRDGDNAKITFRVNISTCDQLNLTLNKQNKRKRPVHH